jgi:hypothetical protein
MVLVKHPEHGVRHVPDGEVAALVAAGWTKWPRSAEEKSRTAAPKVEAPAVHEPEPPPVVKRGPGRPRKA